MSFSRDRKNVFCAINLIFYILIVLFLLSIPILADAGFQKSTRACLTRKQATGDLASLTCYESMVLLLDCNHCCSKYSPITKVAM